MIGLGSYSFFWEQSDTNPSPLSLIGAFEQTRALDVSLFQICDYAPLETMSEAEIREAARVAHELGIRIQLGTKGLEPDRLRRFLRLADAFGADLVRSMVSGPHWSPTHSEARDALNQVHTEYTGAGVTLALETYEQISTPELVSLVTAVDGGWLGICLDPANVVARLEDPRTCVEVCAPHVRNIHVKDFAFHRQAGYVGFSYSGERMGEGLHDYSHLRETVRPQERNIDEIVEHWVPWQGDPRTTISVEREWTRATLDYLRRMS